MPAWLAVGVGALYTVGAVLTAGSLRHAGVSVRDGLSLVPLVDLLGRGMSVFLSSIGIVLLVMLGLAGGLVSYGMERAIESEHAKRARLRRAVERLDESQEKEDLLAALDTLPPLPKNFSDRRLARFMLWIYFAILAVGVFYASVALVPSVVLWLLIISAALARAVTFNAAMIASAVVTWLSALVVSYYYPTRLASAVVTTSRGHSVSGSLITNSGGDWYLVGAKRQIIAIPDRQVAEATITGRGGTKLPRRLYRIIWNVIS